jgi:hypothetical protein
MVSSSNSSPVIDLGAHLFRISGFILYGDCLIVVPFCSCSIDLSIDIHIRMQSHRSTTTRRIIVCKEAFKITANYS